MLMLSHAEPQPETTSPAGTNLSVTQLISIAPITTASTYHCDLLFSPFLVLSALYRHSTVANLATASTVPQCQK